MKKVIFLPLVFIQFIFLLSKFCKGSDNRACPADFPGYFFQPLFPENFADIGKGLDNSNLFTVFLQCLGQVQ